MDIMDERIREIYEACVRNSEGRDTVRRVVDKEIMELFEGKKEEVDWRELEEYRDELFAVADMAERAGFIRGFKYGAGLMAEGLAGDKSISKP